MQKREHIDKLAFVNIISIAIAFRQILKRSDHVLKKLLEAKILKPSSHLVRHISYLHSTSQAMRLSSQITEKKPRKAINFISMELVMLRFEALLCWTGA